jgi:hypothetical protein
MYKDCRSFEELCFRVIQELLGIRTSLFVTEDTEFIKSHHLEQDNLVLLNASCMMTENGQSGFCDNNLKQRWFVAGYLPLELWKILEEYLVVEIQDSQNPLDVNFIWTRLTPNPLRILKNPLVLSYRYPDEIEWDYMVELGLEYGSRWSLTRKNINGKWVDGARAKLLPWMGLAGMEYNMTGNMNSYPKWFVESREYVYLTVHSNKFGQNDDSNRFTELVSIAYTDYKRF